MTRSGMTAGVMALLAALLLGSASRAGDPDKDDAPPTPSEQLRELRQLQLEVARLKRLQDQDREDFGRALRRIAEQLDRIERRLARMADSSSSRSAGFRGLGGAPVAIGTVRLDNRLASTATVNIDGVDYPIAPFSVRVLPGLPAGVITYTVTATGRQVSLPRRTTVRGNETLTLTIY